MLLIILKNWLKKPESPIRLRKKNMRI